MNTAAAHDSAHAQYVTPEGSCLWCARLYLEAEVAKLIDLYEGARDERDAALLQIDALKKYNVSEVMRHDERVATLTLQIEEGRKKTLLGLWHLLRAYAGGGMPPMVTQGIKLACRNVGMSEDHIASAELGGGDPDFVMRETEKRISEERRYCDHGWDSTGEKCAYCGLPLMTAKQWIEKTGKDA